MTGWSTGCDLRRHELIALFESRGRRMLRAVPVGAGLPADRASVVVAKLTVPEGTCARSQLIWRYSVGADRIAYVALEAGEHEYVFASSAYVPGSTLVGLRFDPLLCAGSVNLLDLEVGERGAP
jgi:hypothetical protein